MTGQCERPSEDQPCKTCARKNRPCGSSYLPQDDPKPAKRRKTISLDLSDAELWEQFRTQHNVRFITLRESKVQPRLPLLPAELNGIDPRELEGAFLPVWGIHDVAWGVDLISQLG